LKILGVVSFLFDAKNGGERDYELTLNAPPDEPEQIRIRELTRKRIDICQSKSPALPYKKGILCILGTDPEHEHRREYQS